MLASLDADALELVLFGKISSNPPTHGSKVCHPHWETVLALYATCKAVKRSIFDIIKARFGLEYDQADAFFRAIRGCNLFITGGAGTGKSYVIDMTRTALVQMLPPVRCVRTTPAHGPSSDEGDSNSESESESHLDKGVSTAELIPAVGVAAPTGVAAANVMGRTIASMIGARKVNVPSIQIGYYPDAWPDIAAEKAKRGESAMEDDEEDEMGDDDQGEPGEEGDDTFFAPVQNPRVQETLCQMRVLILDEVSMADDVLIAQLAETCRDACRLPKGTNPFHASYDARGVRQPAHIQLILVGDFGQLPPVLKKGSLRERAVHDARSTSTRYMFQSLEWERLRVQNVELTVKKRTNSAEFTQHLSDLRAICLRRADDSDLDAGPRAELEPDEHQLLDMLRSHAPPATLTKIEQAVRTETIRSQAVFDDLQSGSNIAIYQEVLTQLRDGTPLYESDLLDRLRTVTRDEELDPGEEEEELSLFGNRAPRSTHRPLDPRRPTDEDMMRMDAEKLTFPCVDNWNRRKLKQHPGKVNKFPRVDKPAPNDPAQRLPSGAGRRVVELKEVSMEHRPLRVHVCVCVCMCMTMCACVCLCVCSENWIVRADLLKELSCPDSA